MNDLVNEFLFTTEANVSQSECRQTQSYGTMIMKATRRPHARGFLLTVAPYPLNNNHRASKSRLKPFPGLSPAKCKTHLEDFEDRQVKPTLLPSYRLSLHSLDLASIGLEMEFLLEFEWSLVVWRNSPHLYIISALL